MEEVNLLSMSKNHVDVTVLMARDANLPWCLLGDFNNVTSQQDKKGGHSYPTWLIDGFNDCLKETGLQDLDLIGHPFTWERGRNTNYWIEIRLDRVLANASWLDGFPMTSVYNLEGSPSDHSPVLMIPKVRITGNQGNNFRFENAWLSEPMCGYIVEECWKQEAGEDVSKKITRCARSLQPWGKEITCCFSKRIKECKQRLKVSRSGRDRNSVAAYRKAKEDLFLVLDQKEVFWRQRSKQLWLQAGEKNTKFFHASCNARRRTNRIQRLKDEEGHWYDWENGLHEHIKNYYEHLFTSNGTQEEEVLNCVPKSITEDQNAELLKSISDEEVRFAVFQMHLDKSPGPDGMTPAFFQKHWQVVGQDIVKLVKRFFSTGEIEMGLSETNIVLIPKKKSPAMLTELRPIALCNVVMKIITKVIANRLKRVLDTVISSSQSAFLPDRLISDNIMVSFEIMHYLKRKKFGREGFMPLKLDMSKAYDRVEWNFLREGLSAIVQKFEAKKWLQGVKICNNAPTVTHMLFADNSYIYCKENLQESEQVLKLLKVYEAASGQRINRDKSSVFFSSNVIDYNRAEICGKLSMQEADEFTTYLGLPNILGRRKSVILGYLRDRVKTRIQSWNKKKLPRSAKEILIKSVAQSLPVYAMSVFLLPKEIIKEIEVMLAKFWWSSNGSNSNGLNWMA
ncbi:hypothetical protein AgCh_023701 [Apium graveolens]